MAKQSIAIVDSDKSTIHLLNKALSNDYLVQHYNSAEEALLIINQKTPDIIIFEFQLPGISGIEFFDKIKESGALLIMISSLDDGNMVLKFIQKGVRNYIMKDEMLIDSVKEVFMEEL